jgi:hypothetical protein
MAVTHSKPFGDPVPVSAQVDWSGAFEVTFQYRGAPGYDWPLLKIAGNENLRRTSSREIREYTSQGYVISEATYRGRAFGRDMVSIEGTVTTEPITAHPRFSDLAGTPEDPNPTHAIWENRNGVNTFVQWKNDSDYAGMDSFLSPEWTASVEWMSQSRVSVFQPGIIYALPDAGDFEDNSGFEWLCTAISQQPHGNAYRITAQLLGSNDWPSAIYTT